MRTSRGCRIGCLTASLMGVLSLVLLVRWWTAPIDIPRPQRPPEPADNPYDVYRSLAAYTAQIFRTDPMLSYAERELFPSRREVRVDRPALAQYLLQKMQPVRLEYRRHLHKPCVVIMEYTPAWEFPELAEFRRWANVEALDIALAAREGDDARAIEDYRTVLLLSEQIRNQGTILHYLIGSSMQSAVTRQMSEVLSQLSPQQCDRLLQVVREWERKRVSPVRVVGVERDFYLTVLHDLYSGRYDTLRAFTEHRAIARWNPKWLNLRLAAREGMAYFRWMEKELSKPIIRQRRPKEPRHPVASLLLPVYDGLTQATGYATTRVLLLGCAAAVRAYRMRHGSYPATLSEAGANDLDKDPFTGGSFVYKPAGEGFLLYSVGKDGVDDGGKRVPEHWDGSGDVSLLPFYGRRVGTVTEQGEPVWLR